MLQKLSVLTIFALLFAAACQTQSSLTNANQASGSIVNNSTNTT